MKYTFLRRSGKEGDDRPSGAVHCPKRESCIYPAMLSLREALFAEPACRLYMHDQLRAFKTCTRVHVVVTVCQEPRVISVSYSRNGGLSVAAVRKNRGTPEIRLAFHERTCIMQPTVKQRDRKYKKLSRPSPFLSVPFHRSLTPLAFRFLLN